jgi:hypothetical protein
MPEINLKNILQFIQGNANMLGDKFNLLPKYKKEQVTWRLDFCRNDCVKEGKCKFCGCSVPGKLYVDQSCNGGKRFPDMMNENDWNEYKKLKNIVIKL